MSEPVTPICAGCQKPFTAVRGQWGKGRPRKYCAPNCRPPNPGARVPRMHPAMTEREYTDDEAEFLKACDHYKRVHKLPYLLACDYLKVIRGMGYAKVATDTGSPVVG